MPAQKTKTKRRYGLVILSMHRSGSSALAGLLGKMGCDLPQELMPANRFNEKGHFESLKVYRMNDKILSSGGSRWDDWRVFDPNWMGSEAAQEFMAQGKQVLKDEYNTSRLFVLKDPRICRLMPFWQKLLKAMKIEPVYIHSHRNPIEVARSLESREKWLFSYGLVLWLRHVLESEIHTRGTTRVFTSYNQVMNDWEGVVQAIQAKCKTTFPRETDQVYSETNDFLSSDLRHNTLSEDSVTSDPEVSRWVSQAYSVFEAWAQTGEKKADYNTLDALRAQLNDAETLLGDVVEARKIMQEPEGCTTVTAQRDDALAQLEDLEQQTQHAQERAADLTRHVVRLTKECDDLGSMARLERMRLHDYVKGLEQASTTVNDKLRDTEARLASANKTLGKAALDHKALIQQRTQKNAQIMALKEERAMFLSSTSWKLTAPLRRLIRTLRR
ncbi:MAG: hypothetical protein AB8B82_15350 [Roseovarius sp.]